MATTNWVSGDLFYEKYPRTYRFLQDLVMAMEECAKNIGKKSFFGKDKGLIAIEKFEKALTTTLLAMITDGIISKNDSPSEIRLQLVNMIKLFASVFPNWQLAYAFANKFFVETPEVSEKKIEGIMMLMSVAFREAAETTKATEEFQVILEKAEEQGDAEAQYNLGVMYAKGQGVSQSDTEAVKWYRKAAEQGYAEAQYSLGWMYASGRGVPQNDTEVAKWFRKAAEQGVAGAQCNLGWMYVDGRGVSQSDTEAAKWWRKAAEQGYATAQYSLGWMYANGRGVPQNDTEAAKWWRKAAEQGDATAQCMLGLMYAKGQGVPIDYEEAYMWVYIAATNGDEKGQGVLTDIEKLAPYQEISRAKQRAQEFLAKQGQ